MATRPEPRLQGKRLALVAGALVVALVASVVVRVAVADDSKDLVVVHWSNSHLTRDGLLPEMADEFNDDDHRTASGQQIKVVVVACDSAVQKEDLLRRARGEGKAQRSCKTEDGARAGDPTIVTPQSKDWLVDVNHAAERTVVDVGAATDIARTWLGIVTYSEIADCLRTRSTELGYGDILALRSGAEGWAGYDCALTSWGRPRIAFTNPNTSTSGRNVLVSLYAMATGKSPEQLTVEDVDRTDVVEFVKGFQGLVDHYLPGTIPLNTKIDQGPEFGQFFLMPEDNLVSLYQGKEKAIGVDGKVKEVPPVKDLVMLYPKEGSVLNAHAAGVVIAPWVTPDHVAAAEQWIEHLQDDAQQRRFIGSGFRPSSASQLAVDAQAFAEWGLVAKEPERRIEPGELQPEVLQKIISSWGTVKNPAIVTFVVDTSGSMEGTKLDQVKKGLLSVVDAMSVVDRAGTANQVGLVTFSAQVNDPVLEPRPIRQARFEIADAVERMEARGATALYDAVKRGIQLSDSAAGDARARRAVVVLSDGAATDGICLHDIVAMQHAQREEAIAQFCGHEGDEATDAHGAGVDRSDLTGFELRPKPVHDVQVYFVGFGKADVNIGRILAQATDAEYQGSTDEDLASVIEELSGYF